MYCRDLEYFTYANGPQFPPSTLRSIVPIPFKLGKDTYDIVSHISIFYFFEIQIIFRKIGTLVFSYCGDLEYFTFANGTQFPPSALRSIVLIPFKLGRHT